MNSKKKNIVIALMVAMFLGAVEGTVVTTAMPTIVKELHGFSKISLVFSIYLLTAAITTPIYGKLADLYGRRNILCIGIIIFLIGSALCGTSMNIYMLIVFRGIQGMGAGSIFTVSFTIVGDVFPIEERAKVQGWISSVWGIASLVGPFIGGLLIDYLSWHWIFYINIPFGILSVILLQKNMVETIKKEEHSVDYKGIIVLSASIVIFLLAVLDIGTGVTIFSLKIIAPVLCTIVLLIVFYLIETKAPEPLIPFEIFNLKVNVINLISFLICAILIGTNVYLPIYIQNILGFNATISGLSLASMSISWLMSSFILSKLLPKYGEKIIIFVSALIILISSICLYTLNTGSSLILLIGYAFIMGFGYGGILTTVTIVIQESVDAKNRGAAMASNSLLRTIGQTIGVSIFGVVFNLGITKYLSMKAINNVNPDNLYGTSSAVKSLISSTNVKASLNYGFHSIALIFIIISILCCVFSALISNSLGKNCCDKQK